MMPNFTFRDFTARLHPHPAELAKVDESVRIRDDPDQSNGYFQDIRHPQQEVLQPARGHAQTRVTKNLRQTSSVVFSCCTEKKIF
ncbi:hypothetical protein Leryth_027266 [Lithospermum erythrorhizon]|nr:hypothetical protein Leryth_027266 [Lithospermum erythrorhizon]